MSSKFITLTPEVYDYMVHHRSRAVDPILDELRAETEKLGDISRMLISREQGSFLTLLTTAIRARSAIEIGTFTGTSSTCIARGLPADGSLLCLDQSEEWTSLARRFWKKAGVESKIQLILGPAEKSLRTLPPSSSFDLAFIDANKTGYDTYFEILLPHMKSGSLLIFDNMLWKGELTGPIHHPDGQAIDQLNKKLAQDPRVEAVLLPIADGLMVCRKI